MLSLFKGNQVTNILHTTLAEDTVKLAKQLKKVSAEKLIGQQLSQQVNLLSEAIKAEKAKSLPLLLQHHAPIELSTTEANGYLHLALQQENSLPLLAALLKHSINEDLQPILADCFNHCSDQQLMLHLSLLLNHGADITEALVIKALNSEQRPLIHFFIQSGADMPQSVTALTCNEETRAYAQKCIEDKKIREMFL